MKVFVSVAVSAQMLMTLGEDVNKSLQILADSYLLDDEIAKIVRANLIKRVVDAIKIEVQK
jgi:hypothetical protein